MRTTTLAKAGRKEVATWQGFVGVRNAPVSACPHLRQAETARTSRRFLWPKLTKLEGFRVSREPLGSGTSEAARGLSQMFRGLLSGWYLDGCRPASNVASTAKLARTPDGTLDVFCPACSPSARAFAQQQSAVIGSRSAPGTAKAHSSHFQAFSEAGARWAAILPRAPL